MEEYLIKLNQPIFKILLLATLFLFTFSLGKLRSITNKKTFLKDKIFMDSQVIVIQESFLKGSYFNLPNKISYRRDRPGVKGGGLITCVDSSLPSTMLNINLPPSDNECMGVKIQLQKKIPNHNQSILPKRQLHTEMAGLSHLLTDSPLSHPGGFQHPQYRPRRQVEFSRCRGSH